MLKFKCHVIVRLAIITSVVTFTILRLPAQQGNANKDADSTETNNPNFIMISAIKSIAGETPDDEFLDLVTYFKITPWLVQMTSIDVALSNVDTDTVGSTQTELTEAGFSMNYAFEPDTSQPRIIFLGPHAKVFNTDVFVGLHIGSMETGGALLSSHITVAWAFRAYAIDAELNAAADKKKFKNNILIEFSATAQESVPIIENLRIKGGVLFPLGGSPNKDISPRKEDISVRIAVEVPIGGIIEF